MSAKRPPPVGALLGTAALLLATTQPALAFGLEEEVTRFPRGKPITFVVNMANAPSTLSQEQVVDVARKALAPWTRIATAQLPLTLGSVINDPAKTSPQPDGTNVIFWEASFTPRGDMFAGKAYPFGAECDILLQPRAPFTLIDVQAILLHEVGHCLGLKHSAAPGVMTKFQGLPSLGQDDMVGVSVLHPHHSVSLTRKTATIKGRLLRGAKPLLGAVLRAVDRKTRRISVAGFSGLIDNQRRVDPSGRFELPGLPPGDYELSVEPMDAFVSADPAGYGAPVKTPPEPFKPFAVELPSLEAGDAYDVATLDVEDR